MIMIWIRYYNDDDNDDDGYIFIVTDAFFFFNFLSPRKLPSEKSDASNLIQVMISLFYIKLFYIYVHIYVIYTYIYVCTYVCMLILSFHVNYTIKHMGT